MDNYNYLEGADNSLAPWNKRDLPEREIEVLVSITLSKTVKIKVDDYVEIEGVDEDGYYKDIDYSECDLEKAVKEQVYLPHQLNIVQCLPGVHIPPAVISDFNNWEVDELEVIIE